MLSTAYVPGVPDWLDLGTPDTDAAAAFYTTLFGWEHRSAGPEAGGYGFFLYDGKVVAGVGPLTDEGAASAWTVYFHTLDADATTKAVEQAGGAVRVAPMDVFDFGRTAAFTDPTGADFAVWQPARTPGGLEAVGVPNSLAWTELYTTDAAAAGAFYRSVFSWQITEQDVGGGITYAVLAPAIGGSDSEHGGLMQLQKVNLDAGATSEWHPYFAVADCDITSAAATGAGATLLIPPMDAGNVGRIAMFLDPAGAAFAILTPRP